MKRDQAFNFWDALDNNTSLKVVLSAFENKTGYGGKRTLQRYAQAHEGFKEGLTSDVVARKTGWRLKYVEKIRSWWKQKYRKKTQDEQKPDEKISSKEMKEAQHEQGPDMGISIKQWKEAQNRIRLIWESSPERQAAERRRLIRLLHDWQQELAAYSPVQLLQARLDKAYEDAQAHYYTNKDTKTLYVGARQRHRLRIRPVLQVQNDLAFALLRLTYPNSKVWLAFQSWLQQEIPYASAFYRMLYEAESLADDAIDTALARFDKEVIKGVDWVDADTSSGFAKRFAIKRLLAVLLLCDLLACGIAERPSDSYLADLVNDLEGLRLKVNIELSAVTRITPKGGWSSGIMDILAESADTALELTAPFLDELAQLRRSEIPLIGQLTTLKSVIESVG